MSVRLSRLASFGAVLGMQLGLSACACPYRPAAARDEVAPTVRPYPRGCLRDIDRIAVIGDVQRTSLLECCLLGREVNDREQALLLGSLDRQRFRGLVLLGDMAFDSTPADWAHFDTLMEPLRRPHAGFVAPGEPTAFFPVLGNHDYSGWQWDAAARVNERFSGLRGESYYAFDWGNVRMIVLNGNRERLCPPSPRSARCAVEWQRQLDWLADALRRVDEAPAQGRAALLFVHQSPYTQSPLVANDQSDAADFARLLLNSNRGLAMFSAHAHGYERYRFVRDESDRRAPKYFVVSAGGGGPRPSERRRFAMPDEAQLPWPRPFNYVLLEQDKRGIQIKVCAVDKGALRVRELVDERALLPFESPMLGESREATEDYDSCASGAQSGPL